MATCGFEIPSPAICLIHGYGRTHMIQRWPGAARSLEYKTLPVTSSKGFSVSKPPQGSQNVLGIVMKRALISASLLSDYGPIRRNIKAIVFMGTPHKGSRLSSYLTPPTRIVNNLVPTSPFRSDLIGNLQVLSRTLSEVSEMSVRALSELIVISFYEQKRMKGLNSLLSSTSRCSEGDHGYK